MQLAKLRKLAGLSQEELGRLSAPPGSTTKHHQPRIYSYESGSKRMSLDAADRIVRVLNKRFRERGVSRVILIDDLFGKPSRRLRARSKKAV